MIKLNREGGEIMSYEELFKTISTPWVSSDEIMKIACCGRDSARKIRDSIIHLIKKENKDIPYSKKIMIPTKRVIEYLDLDIEYIKDMAMKEHELNCMKKLT